jgi:hypothetical protein
MWVQPVMFVVLEGCSLPVLDATRVALFSLSAGVLSLLAMHS